MPNQILHPIGKFGETPVGDRQRVVIPAHHRLRRHEFLDVPVGEKNDGGRRVGRPLPLRSFWRRRRLNVRQFDKPQAAFSLLGEGIDCRPILLLESRDLRPKFCNLDLGENAFDGTRYWLSQWITP